MDRVAQQQPPPFESLDFVYMPSRDTAADLRHFTEGLGARAVFAIEAFDAKVAMVELSDGPPALLLADHLEGDQPVLVFRVDDLDAAVAELERRGARPGPRFGIPYGPISSVELQGGQRIAVYERIRPEADEHLRGRRDF
jgi:hypothetical protein